MVYKKRRKCPQDVEQLRNQKDWEVVPQWFPSLLLHFPEALQQTDVAASSWNDMVSNSSHLLEVAAEFPQGKEGIRRCYLYFKFITHDLTLEFLPAMPQVATYKSLLLLHFCYVIAKTSVVKTYY